MPTKIYYIQADPSWPNDFRISAIADDGRRLAGSFYMLPLALGGPLGCTPTVEKHILYNALYPDGWEIEWVEDPEHHAGFQQAVRQARARKDQPDPEFQSIINAIETGKPLPERGT